jgi:crotonobetainyl-CoA:carnitine CoA-transferase CaiB-like acyl-CoA transferase
MTAATLNRLPLEGIKVLDLGQIYNGPYAGLLLAQAGADVVKVEPLRGDALRGRGRTKGKMPWSMAALNQNKRGLALDLKSGQGKALLFDLARQADILLENFAPGVMDRLGCGAKELQTANPRLIYATGSGFGTTGPDRDNLAMDLTIQASSGMMSVTGPEGGAPMKAGMAVCDFFGGIHLYSAIMTALFERSVTGIGRVVEVAMVEAALPVLTTNIAGMLENGGVPVPRRGNRHPAKAAAPYNVYECQDGHVALLCIREEHWHSVARVIGREDLLDDLRFADPATRAAHDELVDEIMTAWSSKLPKAEAVRQMQDAHVACAAIRDLTEIVSDPHMRGRGAIFDQEHPQLGNIPLPRSPLRFHGAPLPPDVPSPDLGEHSRVVLAEWLNLSQTEIDLLYAEGAIA